MVDAWASTAAVADITGATVTAAQVTQAQADIEIFSNRIYTDTPRIRTRDLYWLERAVAYQAAWAQGQFDLNTRLNTDQVQQDGVVANLSPDAVVLAPRAKQALQKVSWMRSRTVHIRSAFEGAGPVGNVLSDSADDHLEWAPTGGGGS